MTPDQARPTNPLPELMPTALDDDGRVGDDLECAKCGYNLRTRLPADRCPECNESVRRSIQKAVQTAAACVRNARAGAEQLKVAGWALALAAILGMLLIASGLSKNGSTYAYYGFVIAIAITWAAAFAAGAFGVVNFTVRDSHAREGRSARRVFRWGTLVILLSGAIPFDHMLSGTGVVMQAVLSRLMMFVLVVLPCAFLLHAGKLMRRVEQPDIALFARRLSWLVAIGSCIAIACLILAELKPQLARLAHVLCLSLLAGLSVIAASLFRQVAHALAAARPLAEQYASEIMARIRDTTQSAAKQGAGGKP